MWINDSTCYHIKELHHRQWCYPIHQAGFIQVIAIKTTGMTLIDTTVGPIDVGVIAINIGDVVVSVVMVTVLIIDVIVDSQLTTKGLSDQSQGI